MVGSERNPSVLPRKKLAAKSVAAVQKKLGAKVVTEISPAGAFYPAEDYHQNYYRENPVRYRVYRFSCGRDARLDELWPDRH